MNILKNRVLRLILFVFAVSGQSQDLPWGDDFGDGNYDGWTVVDVAPFASGPSSWTVRNNELLQTSNIYTTENEYSVFTGTHVHAGNKDWADYYFLSRITSGDDDGVGMLFRYRDAKNYYRFLTVADPNNRGPFKRLEKQVNGVFTTLATTTSDLKIPGDFVGKIRVVGDSIYVYENNELLFAVQDNTFGSGKVGLMCYANPEAGFDDIYVTEQDTVYGEKPVSPDPEILTANKKLQVRVFTLNIWVGGKLCTPFQVADLIESLDLDFAGLQECNDSFGNQVAELTGMHLVAQNDCYLLSKTPYTIVKNLPVKGINAWTNIDSQTVSVYNFHIGWDEGGDRSARTMVDDIFSKDPVPLQIAFGDFNDEHYSTQITILEEHMRYCLADLGWAPPQRVTWPAFGFYGGEGAQTIDLIFCNKESKGRAIEGEILNTSPMLADHKPVWATLEFPADKELVGPKLISVTPYLGQEIIELWFDQDLDRESAANASNYQINPLDGGMNVTVNTAIPLKDPRRVRLITSVHDFESKYQIAVSNVTDEFAVPITVESTKEYTIRQNLLENDGAENGVESWQPFGGFINVNERENQIPYNGNYFFTGENAQDLSSGRQTVDLSSWSEDIDVGTLAAEWNCFFATGYEILGEIKASRCEPYDEGEMYIEFVDESDKVLMQASSKRWDTLYWHPYGETSFIPRGTRKAVVYLHSYRKTKNGQSNDASFENAYFSVKKLDQPHNYGINLLENSSAESGDLTGWDVVGSLRTRAHEEEKGRPVSGYYFFSNTGVSSGLASQNFDMSDFEEKINAGELSIKWGGYMRDYIGDSSTEIRVEFYDSDKEEISFATTGEEKVAEWTLYDYETAVPPNTQTIKFILDWNAVSEEGAYFDFLHLLLVDQNLTSVAGSSVPDEFRLDQNYPNPFNPSTHIDYALDQSGNVKLEIFNTLGQQLAVLVDKYQASGSYKFMWNGLDDLGNSVPSGIYFYKLSTTTRTMTKKMMLLR